jgi:hypothetical protein
MDRIPSSGIAGVQKAPGVKRAPGKGNGIQFLKNVLEDPDNGNGVPGNGGPGNGDNGLTG